MYVCTSEPEAYLCIGSGASVVISGQEAEARLLVKLSKKPGWRKLAGGYFQAGWM